MWQGFLCSLCFLCFSGVVQAQDSSAKRGILPIPKEESSSLSTARNHALLIGNNNYQHFDKLNTAVKDVESLSEVLTENYGYRKSDVILLKNATRADIINGMDQLKKAATANDNVLIYYGGHGVYNQSGQGFWIPVDGELNKSANYVSNEELLGRLRAIEVKHKLLISDSCFSGNIFERGLGAPKNYQNPRDEYLEKNALISVQGFASGGNEPVSDGGAQWEGHSIFAYQLIAQLKANRTRWFSASDLGVRVRELVTLDTKNIKGLAEQTPRIRALKNQGHQGGEFYFLRDFDTKPLLIAFQKSGNPETDAQNSTAKEWIKEAFYQNLSIPVEFEPLSELHIIEEDEDHTSLLATMEKANSQIAVIFNIEQKFEETPTTMWEGISTMKIHITAFNKSRDGLSKVSSVSLGPQKLPIKRWPEQREVKQEHLKKNARKVIRKSDRKRVHTFWSSIFKAIN